MMALRERLARNARSPVPLQLLEVDAEQLRYLIDLVDGLEDILDPNHQPAAASPQGDGHPGP